MRRAPIPVRRSFTLIEAMAAVLVLSAIGSASSFLIIEAVDGYTDATTLAQVHTEMSIAMDRVVREIRNIGSQAGPPGPVPDLDEVATDTLLWRDGDGEACGLRRSDGRLELRLGGGSFAVLLDDVATLSFEAYDEDGAAIPLPLTGAACDPVRRVVVQVTCDRRGITDTLRARVFLRSTMDGAGQE